MKFKLTVTIENKIISDADYDKMNLENLLIFDFRSQNKALKLKVKQGWESVSSTHPSVQRVSSTSQFHTRATPFLPPKCVTST